MKFAIGEQLVPIENLETGRIGPGLVEIISETIYSAQVKILINSPAWYSMGNRGGDIIRFSKRSLESLFKSAKRIKIGTDQNGDEYVYYG